MVLSRRMRLTELEALRDVLSGFWSGEGFHVSEIRRGTCKIEFWVTWQGILGYFTSNYGEVLWRMHGYPHAFIAAAEGALASYQALAEIAARVDTGSLSLDEVSAEATQVQKVHSFRPAHTTLRGSFQVEADSDMVALGLVDLAYQAEFQQSMELRLTEVAKVVSLIRNFWSW